MKVRKLSKLDIIDKYLIISMVSVYLVAPAIFQIRSPATHFISMEIWIGLLLSFTVSIVMISSRWTPSLNESFPQSRRIFSTPLLFFLLAAALALQFADFFESIRSFDSSMVRQELWYKDSRDEAIGGRSLIQLANGIIGPLSLILLADLFHISRKRSYISFGLLFLIAATQVGIIALTALHRSPLIFTLAFWILFWHIFVLRIRFTVFRFTVMSLLTFFYLSWAAYFRASTTGKIDFFHGMSGLATARQIEVLKGAVESGSLKYEYGLQFFYNFVSWIPRQLWESKPLTSFSFRVSEMLYGDVGVTTWVRTFTVPGEGYLQFGLIGMVLASMTFVYLYRVMKLIGVKYSYTIPALLSVWVQFPLILRGDLSAFFSRFWMILIAVVIFLSLVKFLGGSVRNHVSINISPSNPRHG